MAGVGTGAAQDPVADRRDHARFLGNGDELRRRNQAALRMLPANQRLITDGVALRQVELRLVVDVEIAAFEGDVKFGLDPVTVSGDLAHLVGIERPVAEAIGPRVLKR